MLVNSFNSRNNSIMRLISFTKKNRSNQRSILSVYGSWLLIFLLGSFSSPAYPHSSHSFKGIFQPFELGGNTTLVRSAVKH